MPSISQRSYSIGMRHIPNIPICQEIVLVIIPPLTPP